MSTCNILGTLRDSGGVVLTGELWISLDAQVIDETPAPDDIYTVKLHKFAIASGVVNLTIAESETSQITYWFRFYAANPDTDSGLDNDPIIDFHAFVPNQASVDFSQLVPTGITKDTLDTAIARLARVLTSNQDFAETLRGGPNPKGAYSSSTYYRSGDFVTYGGSSWLYINANPAAGQTPAVGNTAYWMLIAQKGDAGGTGGQDTAYDATGWSGATWAPTANAVRDIIETLARASQLATYAPLASPTFAGNPTRSSSPLAGDRTSQLATTQWVGNEFAPLASPVLTGNPSAPTQAATDNSTRLATTAFVQNAYNQFVSGSLLVADQTSDQTISTSYGTLTQINWNTERTDSNNLFSGGVYTVPATGWYRVSIALWLANDAPAAVIGFVGLYVGGSAIALVNAYGSVNACINFEQTFYFTQGQLITVHASIVGSGLSNGRVDATAPYLNRLSILRLI